MKEAGQIVLFRFPQTDLAEGKLRPALLLGKIPGPYDDWLICMISSQVGQHIEELPENATIEDAIERLVFLRKIEIGLKQFREGKTVSLDEVEARLKRRRQSKQAEEQ